MGIQPRRRVKKSGRGLVVLWVALIVVLVGGAVAYENGFDNCKQWIARFIHRDSSDQKKIKGIHESGRGVIYDRNFKEMALSLDRVSVFIKPRELGDVYGSAEPLASALGMNEQDLLNLFDQDAQQVWLAKDISVEEEKAVTDLHLQGVFFHREQVRFYPYKTVASQVIGFADHKMGLAGTEYYYHRLLDQASISQDDFPKIDLGGKHRTGNSGHHLVLTIDLKIQDFLEKFVAALGAAHEGAEIAALLMEAETGAIIANANFPSFDPNVFYQYKKESLANTLLIPMAIPVKIRRFFQDAVMIQADGSGDGSDHPSVPWSLAAGTVDPGARARCQQGLGIGSVLELDFSVPNGTKDVDTPGGANAIPEVEADGFPAQATPMQILVALNALFRSSAHPDTRVVLPHVLGRVLERNGESEYPFRGREGSEFLSEQVVSPMMVESWKLLKAQGQKGVLDSVFIEDEHTEIRPVASGSEYSRSKMMFAMLPADTPELMLMVVVRRPYLEPSSLAAKKGTGSDWDLIGPVGKILPSMVALQQVHKNIADMMSRSERQASNYQQVQAQKKETGLASMLAEEHPVMPDLIGLSVRKALRLLQDKKMKVRIQGTGRVVAQSPPPGMPLAHVKECRLTLKKDEKVSPAGNPLGTQVAPSARTGKGKKKAGSE